MALSDLELLKALSAQHEQTHFVRIQVIGETSESSVVYYDEKDIKTIDGLIMGGSLTYNGSSAVRRNGSLSMLAFDHNCNIKDVDNIISINKIIKIEVGLVASIETKRLVLEIRDIYRNTPVVAETAQEQALQEKALVLIEKMLSGQTIWQSLGIYVISNAAISRNLSNWNINITLQDQMALLNGVCGGVIPNSVTHSPAYQELADGTMVTSYPLFTELIKAFLIEFTGLKDNEIYVWESGDIAPPPDAKAIIVIKSNLNTSKTLRNIVSWGGTDPLYLYKENSSGEYPLYSLSAGDNNTLEATLVYGDNLGYQEVGFTYPMDKELTSGIGETVASILDKIKNQLGNYEFFYDKEGVFYFQEIANGIHQGSNDFNLEDSIADRYYATPEAPIAYTFATDDLIISYNDSPAYQNVKNDFVIWGTKGSSNIPIRYRLVIDNIPTSENKTSYAVEIKTDSMGIKRAYKSDSVSTSIDATDWRLLLYYSAVERGSNETPYDAELVQELPKIMDIETGEYYATAGSSKEILNDMDYFIDIICPEELVDISVSRIGRRTYAKKEEGVNCIFSASSFPDINYIELGTAETSTLRKAALASSTPFIQVPQSVAGQVIIGPQYYSAYDAIRVQLNKMLHYTNTISLSTIPLYFLEPNTLIEVALPEENENKIINGVYFINSISVPLTFDGVMSISASRITATL